MLMTLWFGQEDTFLTANSITGNVSFFHSTQSPGCLALAASKAPTSSPQIRSIKVITKQENPFWFHTISTEF